VYVEYDEDVDGAYIWLVDDIEIRRADVTHEVWPDALRDEVGLLFSEDGKLLGIELQPASERLEPEILKRARRYES
jgi:uncharacterized protein YuzE